jgi:hypothetical protein
MMTRGWVFVLVDLTGLAPHHHAGFRDSAGFRGSSARPGRAKVRAGLTAGSRSEGRAGAATRSTATLSRSCRTMRSPHAVRFKPNEPSRRCSATGPIAKDRTFYYVEFDQERLRASAQQIEFELDFDF